MDSECYYCGKISGLYLLNEGTVCKECKEVKNKMEHTKGNDYEGVAILSI
jgi:hypothetical protein